ncbi:unnamed protein product, partial [Lymnaea stagnalis]
MASISKERLREMEEEMDRFEAEIQAPGGPPVHSRGFILGANTFDRVQAQLSSIRQESTRLQQQRIRPDDNDVDDGNHYGDEDLRNLSGDFRTAHKRKYHGDDDDDDDEENEYHDIDERPGRPQGPLIPPPPPPPAMPSRLPPTQGPPLLGDMSVVNMFAPPPPPPPEPEDLDEGSTLSFKPYAPGEGPSVPRPAFMPPQLRHRLPPPGGPRPPFPRPPMRMGGPYGGPMGPPRHMMGPGPNMGPMGPGMMGPQGPHMGMPGGPMAPPGPPGMEGGMQFMNQSMDMMMKPLVIEQPKVVYSAAPVINVDRKKDDKKKKKKKKAKAGGEGPEEGKDKTGQPSKESGTSHVSNQGTTATTAEND